jgi:hypothetical protein
MAIDLPEGRLEVVERGTAVWDCLDPAVLYATPPERDYWLNGRQVSARAATIIIKRNIARERMKAGGAT